MGDFVLINIAMTFYVILGLFILRRLALYILKMRICGARFSVARLKETIFAFFVLILRWFSLLPCQLLNEHPYLLVDKCVQD